MHLTSNLLNFEKYRRSLTAELPYYHIKLCKIGVSNNFIYYYSFKAIFGDVKHAPVCF